MIILLIVLLNTMAVSTNFTWHLWVEVNILQSIGYPVMCPCFTTTVPIKLAYLFYLWQKQQAQMQTVLKRLSQKQNLQSKVMEQSVGQQLSNIPSEHSAIVQRFKEILAEKDGIIKKLQKNQQFSDKVIKK